MEGHIVHSLLMSTLILLVKGFSSLVVLSWWEARGAVGPASRSMSFSVEVMLRLLVLGASAGSRGEGCRW